jgi:hypothetical protein
MKIIPFQSPQRNENVVRLDQPREIPSLLLQYRDSAKDEFLVWTICAFCAVASIVLCLSQLRNDVNRVQRDHVSSMGVSRLANQTTWVVEVSKRL